MSARPRPDYARPRNLTATMIAGQTAELVWTVPPWANYFKVHVSTRADFDRTAADFQRIHVNESPNVNAVTVTGLEPGKKYFARVCVANWEGARLSEWSAVKSFRTTTT